MAWLFMAHPINPLPVLLFQQSNPLSEPYRTIHRLSLHNGIMSVFLTSLAYIHITYVCPFFSLFLSFANPSLSNVFEVISTFFLTPSAFLAFLFSYSSHLPSLALYRLPFLRNSAFQAPKSEMNEKDVETMMKMGFQRDQCIEELRYLVR